MAHTDIQTMTLSGGASCLDLVNTGLETGGIPVERLHRYEDILTLAERIQLLPSADLRDLRRRAQHKPEAALQCWKQTLAVRQILTKIFIGIASKKLTGINKRDMAQLNTWRAKALAGQGFIVEEKGLVLGWADGGETLMQPLWAFMLSANALLQKPDLNYLKCCAGCDWVFYDQSKSHRRKWCDMQTCGSSAKAKRYYQRKKAEEKV